MLIYRWKERLLQFSLLFQSENKEIKYNSKGMRFEQLKSMLCIYIHIIMRKNFVH